MKNKDFNEILKKCFGKEKDDRYHAIAMLIIYGIFLLIIVLMIRVGGTIPNNDDNTNRENAATPTPTSTPEQSENNNEEEHNNINVNDINYSYLYTITYNGVSEIYSGQKIDDKEKFTIIKDGINKNYAILGDNYLILENDIYHITENPSNFFKYCDAEKVLTMIENITPIKNNNTMSYSISNSSLLHSFNDKITLDNNQTNTIILTLSNDSLESINLDLSNYISSVEGNSSTLIIKMEFVNVGTTKDFEIKTS